MVAIPASRKVFQKARNRLTQEEKQVRKIVTFRVPILVEAKSACATNDRYVHKSMCWKYIMTESRDIICYYLLLCGLFEFGRSQLESLTLVFKMRAFDQLY